MKIEQVPVSKINPAVYNPRKDLQPGDPEYEALKHAIKTHGFVDPLVWNVRTGRLVGGHQRLKVLVNEFGATKVWCSVVDIEDEKQEMSLNVSLNKIEGEWDFPKLQGVLFKFQGDPDDNPFKLATGFNKLEFDQILAWQSQQTSAETLEQTPEERMKAYEEGAIKQIVLYFPGKQYDGIVRRLEAVREKERLDDNTAAFVRLLEFYEKNQTRKVKLRETKAGRSKRR